MDIIHELTMLYLQKTTFEELTPGEFTQKYLEVYSEIKPTYEEMQYKFHEGKQILP